MELVQRYIYAVTQKLPAGQRPEIEKELQGLIEDMLEERTQYGQRDITPQDVEEVLLELGSPSKLADQYRGNPRYLIGPALLGMYWSVLKIVLFAIGISMLVVFVIDAITSPSEMVNHFTDHLTGFIMGCFQGFAWVTVIFAVIEYTGAHNESDKSNGKGKRWNLERPWQPSQLPPLPDKQSTIRRSDPIASIVFTVAFLVLLTTSIDLFGVWRIQDDVTTIVHFFNREVFQSFVPFIWIVLSANILNEILKLVAGRWTFPLLMLEIGVTLLSFVLAIFMFSDLSIWNPEFVEQMSQTDIIPKSSDLFGSLSNIWQVVTHELLYLIGLITVIHLIYMVVKGYRLGLVGKLR